MRNNTLYSSRDVTVTDTFIRLAEMQDQVIRMSEIRGSRVERIQVGNYNDVASGMLVAGLIFIGLLLPLGVVLLAMAAAAAIKKQYRYVVIIDWNGYDKKVVSLENKAVARRIHTFINKAIRQTSEHVHALS